MAEPTSAAAKGYLVPVIAAGAVILLVVTVIYVSASTGRKMSDGSNGSVDDPDLKDAAPGVKYRDIKEGAGEPCPAGAKVKMHYTGWLENGDVFDGSREGNAAAAPVAFDLKSLIKGWQEGIPGMKRGGVRKLVISADKAYGPQARPANRPGGVGIPANSTLIFEVELADFTPPTPTAPRTPRADLTKLSDGTAPGADDPNLKPIGTDGLMYRDLKVGTGPECPPGATPIMDYAGWLTGGSLFDSSWNPGREPLDMPLGELIKGWQQGVPGMKVGGVRKLVIPPGLGYGNQRKEKIPPGSTLVFEIELLGLK